MDAQAVKELVRKLTLEEKAGLCSGRGNWYTKAVERLDIPALLMNDGPHGLRLLKSDSNDMHSGSGATVCFPAACATAASFDRGLLRRLGEELGAECQANGVQLLLGPGVNIKRSPLCGRNFEYFSEDPLLAGELAAAFVNGVQSRGVGASLKHFFANNQEHRRMDSSSELDERTQREIYLAAFERVVKQAQPWTVMAAYNKVGGVHCTENGKYLKGVLREEWGFEGTVISDWGATHGRAAAVAAGCDLTMPGEPETDSKIVDAVHSGQLAEADLDTACENILSLVFRGVESICADAAMDLEGGDALSEEIAAQSIVLLKNEKSALPLDKGARVAFIGEFAAQPRYQGSGSSHINSFRVTSAMDAIQDAGLTGNVVYAQGYNGEQTDDTLLEQAVQAAVQAAVAVVFAGLPSAMESEGFDRKHLRLPASHNQLIQAVSAAQPNTVVVLHNGAPVEMPWAENVKGILEAYLGGQAIGRAVVRVLYGEENPSGRLPESFPLRLEDTPSYLSYSGEAGYVPYSERMFVGYRYYESKQQPVLFPFGYGLSYTSFAYSNLRTNIPVLKEDSTISVSVDIENTGEVAGREVVQLYVSPCACEYHRPVRELRGFTKLLLQPGETQTATFLLAYRDFACWSPEMQDWFAQPGEYRLQIARSASEPLLELAIHVEGRPLLAVKEYDESTLLSDFVLHPQGRQYFDANIGRMIAGMAAAGLIPQDALAVTETPGAYESGGDDTMMALPVSFMLSFCGAGEDEKTQLFAAMNTH